MNPNKSDCCEIFYWGACPVCKGTESLRACGGCRLIYYCCTFHQKMHWRVHKRICYPVKTMLISGKVSSLFSKADEYFRGASPSVWMNFRIRTTICIQLSILKQLSPFERQMIMFPKVCEVCKIDAHVELRNCDKCLCVCYCSPVHQNDDINHVDKCVSLKMCRELDLSMNDTSYLTYLDNFPSLHLNEYGIPQTMDELLTFLFTAETSNLQREKLLCSELLSCPMTLLYNLEQRSRVKPLKDSFTVHIVGASELECGYPKVWNNVLQGVPLVPRLHVVFVGPEVLNNENNFSTRRNVIENERNMGKLQLEYYNGFYHNYRLSEEYVQPEVIVTFNCGFQEYSESTFNDSWRDTLPYFFHIPDVYIIITSYTKTEAIKDLNALMSHSNGNAKISLHCSDNPFCSKRPHRDWEQLRSDVFFANKYMSVVQVSL